jgi:hypothetical protein
MRRSLSLGVTLLVVGPIALAAIPASAQVTNLAYWDFNDLSSSFIDASQRAALFAVDGGASAATASMSSDFSFRDGLNTGTDSIGISSFLGTNVNRNIPGVGQTTSGFALALQGAAGTGFPNNGRFLEFGVSTAGFKQTQISYGTRGTATGFDSDQFQYSTDGVNFENFSSAYNGSASTNFFLVGFDLSPITALANNPNARFRIVFNGSTSNVGNNRIDNLQINGVPIRLTAAAPEPGTLVLVLPFLGGLVAFRLRGRNGYREGMDHALDEHMEHQR